MWEQMNFVCFQAQRLKLNVKFNQTGSKKQQDKLVENHHSFLVRKRPTSFEVN